jgi:hypothetical protein
MGSLRLDESNTASFILADASVLSSNSENNKRNENYKYPEWKNELNVCYYI